MNEKLPLPNTYLRRSQKLSMKSLLFEYNILSKLTGKSNLVYRRLGEVTNSHFRNLYRRTSVLSHRLELVSARIAILQQIKNESSSNIGPEIPKLGLDRIMISFLRCEVEDCKASWIV